MGNRCAACGFAADTTITLPDPWVAYLHADGASAVSTDELSLPVCVGCQRTIEQFLDPKHPTGGTDPDAAVRTFLDDLTLPDHESQ